MNLAQARLQTINAFNQDNHYYNSSSPYGYSNFIDGMAWVGLMVGACMQAGDTHLADMGVQFLNRLLEVGPDARTFAPLQAAPEWIKSITIEGLWYKKKAQSFAGPAGLAFAVKNGAAIATSGRELIDKAHKSAKTLRKFGWVFGHLCKWLKWPRQHINSMFLAYLIAEKTPPSSMRWLAADNPFYEYIYGKKLNTAYPDPRKLMQGATKVRKDIVPLAKRKVCTWVFRIFPYNEYVDMNNQGYGYQAYTPIWQVTAEYLQQQL